MKRLIKIKCGIIFLLLIFSLSISSNSWAQNNLELHSVEMPDNQPQKAYLSIALFAKINENEMPFLKLDAVLFSMVDSVFVHKIEIESPSFVKPGLRGELETFCLITGQTKRQTYNFTIENNESFKLKAIVYGDLDNGKTKVSATKNLFFFWDENHYVISDDITQIIGLKKHNGELITLEEMKIFNRVEIE